MNNTMPRPAEGRSAPVVILRYGQGAERSARCLALARELRARRGLAPLFAVDDPRDAAAIRAAGFDAADRPVGVGEALWLETLCALNGAGALVLDGAIDADINQARIARWRAAGLVILALDDRSARRLSVDIAVYPGGADPNDLGWFGFRGELLCGAEWALNARHAMARLGAMLASRLAPLPRSA